MGRHPHPAALPRPRRLALARRREHLAGDRLRPRAFSPDTWTYELRPIIDKEMGPWYVSINPVLGKSLRGPNAAPPFDFTPNVDVGYDLTSKLNLAIEYYGATGTIKRFEPLAEQEHQLFAAVNIDFGPDWEFNFGYGTALTAGGDKSIVKMILGRRVGGK